MRRDLRDHPEKQETKETRSVQMFCLEVLLSKRENKKLNGDSDPGVHCE